MIPLIAMTIETCVGYPEWLFRSIGHPVTWIGELISRLDHVLNHGTDTRRRTAGVLLVCVLLLASLGVGSAIEAVSAGRLGYALMGVAASALLAQRSLAQHVADVAEGLENGGVAAGRAAVARIVGRDPERLNEAGVARAAVESLAENFSDGVVAPVFWLWAAGLPGGIAYKAINTADSMIGHRSKRHHAFGWAAARLDDLVNLPASRMTALLLIAAAALLPGASPAAAWRAVRRDAGAHRSPNAGWPEAAMAGALGFALAGPRHYDGVLVEDAVMGAGGRRELGAADIRRALRLYWIADGLLIGLLAALALAGLTW